MNLYNEEVNITLFHSESNIVTLKSDEGKYYIEKRFLEKLKNYPSVYWPSERAAVEAFLLLFLKRRLRLKDVGAQCRIFVPMLYKFRPPDILEMEYCMGTRLLEAPFSDMCDAALWEELFSFLYSLTDVKEEYILRKTTGVFAKQQELFDCMKHWKFKDDVNPPENSYGCLCLGDVSLSNIIVSERGFTLLDFECAHWGYLGYDIGQVLGMMEVYRFDERMKILLECALEKAVKDCFYKECCFYWKRRFVEYYSAKRVTEIKKG